MTTRYVLTLAYNGSAFYGWQKQTADVPTIQSALEHALSVIAQQPIKVTAAGRTDTGVHATAQVVHFDSDANRPISAWVRGVNAHLPNDVAVLHAQAVASEFHARFDAFARRYRYVLQFAPVRSPLLVGRAGWTHYNLDINNIQAACQFLLGEHDFSSFRAAECQAKSPIKTMYSIDIQAMGDLIKLDFHANAFLHHMIRNIVGALVYVGSGRLSVNEFAELIEKRSRLDAPPTFMPDGLYFAGADYPEHFGLMRVPLPVWL